MFRTIVACALVLAVTAPAAAQEVLTAPASTVYVAPTPPPSPSTGTYTTGTSAYDPAYASFPPRDRRGRMLVGTRHEIQNDRGMWGAGLGLFLGGWVLDIVGTALANAISTDRTDAMEQDAQAWSILPLAGPVIQLGIQAPHPAIPITSGLMQIAGLVMFITGMTSQHDAEVPIYAWGDAHDPRTARLGFDLAPTQGGAVGTLTLHL